MKVKTVTRYEYKGQEFKTLLDIQNHLHNLIGENVIDQINKKIDIRHKDLFVLLDILCNKDSRYTLLECLNVNIEQFNEYTEKTEIINILDIK